MNARFLDRIPRFSLLLVAVLTLSATLATPVAATDRPAPQVGSTPPASLNLFKVDAFRYQDPNYYACTATSALVMLNTIALGGGGGSGFRWTPRLGSAAVDSILQWERSHDTLAGGNGSDPHGWRNALNYYGWGSTALNAGSRVYDDFAYGSYGSAMKAGIRQLLLTGKPFGILAWGGRHAQFITGYTGMKGNPFLKNAAGAYTNEFSVEAVYLSDPLKSDGWVNAKIGYSTLANSTNAKLRFVPYAETDSPYDDAYTPGIVPARDEWYGKWVIIAPIR
jgi:hypothetical protein